MIIFLFSIFVLLLTSCDYSNILYEPITYTELSKSVELDTAWISIKVVNNAENVVLDIYNLEIEDVNNTFLNINNTITLNYKDSTIFYYAYTNLKTLNSNVFLNGKISSENITICDSKMFIPIYKDLVRGNNIIRLVLYDNCPWFYILNGNKQMVLQSIKFDVSVDDWK